MSSETETFILTNSINSDIGFLLKILKKNIKKLKSDYKKNLAVQPNSEFETMLHDNFNQINNYYRILLKVNRKTILWTDSDYIPLLGSLILNNCTDDCLPDLSVITNSIEEIQKQKYISNYEFETIIWQFRYTVLREICNLYFQKTNNDRVIELTTLLTKSKTINSEKIAESCNPIEQIYSKEASQIYPNMDRETKHHYRNYTSEISKHKKVTEYEVATDFLKKADKAFSLDSNQKNIHVGYYIYNSYSSITQMLTPKKYITYNVLLSAVLSVLISFLLKSPWLSIILLLPLYKVSKAIIETVFFSRNEVTYLPRMNMNNSIPEDKKTLIVVSCLLENPKDLTLIKEKLIRIYYSNIMDNLGICALCDLKQSSVPILAEDKTIIYNAKKMISELNKEYNGKFSVVIRKRSYCSTQNAYTGYERKRGAVEQLIKYISCENIEFELISGNTGFIKDCKYIVTLDYDTKALMDTIPELIGIASHILNSPEIINQRVRSGYGIIAPRITTKLRSSLKSPFAKYIGGIGSTCAYDSSCCEMYQDSFREGVFSGKGLIDVDAYYKLCCDKFPHEKILSHDILEGNMMRTAFAGDIEMSDNFPSSAGSYYKRLDRWIRGDIQNFMFIRKFITINNEKIKNQFNLLDKYKILDNIRRPVTSIILFSLLIASAFLSSTSGIILTTTVIICIVFPYIISLICSIIANGFQSLSNKYYSGVFTQSKEIIFQGLFAVLFLPLTAFVSFIAILKAIYRLNFSHKNLLQWTTSAQADSEIYNKWSNFVLYFIPSLISIPMIFAANSLTKLLALAYFLIPVILYKTDKSYKNEKSKISQKNTSDLISDLSAMWQFYEDYSVKSDNFLPPDNIQFAPIFRICHRTSPTNIGLMMLSSIIARDFDLIDTDGLVLRTDRTLSSVEKLQKYHGNLYNWYNTMTLEVSDNPYVSSVDSGNFICCMVALKEGLKEYRNSDRKVKELIQRIEKLIENTDLKVFYNDEKELFSIGIDPQNNTQSPNYYDLLMSEARMMSYFAIAKRVVPKKHWRALGRVMSRSGLYVGPVSYSGTMFEFFMPELMLKSEKGSITNEALRFCLYCQKKRSDNTDLPFGISESAYYAFDNNLNYQYKAHGVQKIGLKQGLNNELVISPYSTYLTLSYNLNAACRNLHRLKKYGMYGNYGFYEAIDFTSTRCVNGSIIKSYMAHHIGMSIVAISNALQNNRIQMRFMKDNYMKSADELLSEKILSGTMLYNNSDEKIAIQKSDSTIEENILFDRPNPSDVKLKLLSNGEYTLAIANTGACYAQYQNKDVYLRTTDMLRRPQGCYFALQYNANKHICYSYLPEYKITENMSVEFNQDNVCFYSNTENIQSGMKVFLHSTLPCEIRQFAFKNETAIEQNANLLSYIEPVLTTHLEMTAHPAFCKLFLKEHYDMENRSVFVSRKSRNNEERIYCAVGFIEDIELSCNLSREQVLEKPYGVTGVFRDSDIFIKSYESIPDPCIMLKTPLILLPNEKKELNLFIMTSLSITELYQNIAKLRHEKIIATLSSSVIFSKSIEGVIVSSILPQIYLKQRDSKQIINAIKSNTLDITSLWTIGLSGDFPIISVEICTINTEDRIRGYINAHKILNLCGVKTDLVFIFDDKKNKNKKISAFISKIIYQQNEGWSIDTDGGIHLIDTSCIDSIIINLLYAVSVHFAPQGMIRIGYVSKPFSPVKILPVNKTDIKTDNLICNGGFCENSFICNKDTQLPWCHVLSNPVFGTLLSNQSLGYTYAINSRENKLTPWYNDTMTDNRGEMLLLKTKDRCYDIVLGSAAVFSAHKAEYHGECELFSSVVTVSIADKGCTKKIEIIIEWNSYPQNIDIAYYTEPVLSVTRDNSRLIKFFSKSGALIATNPYNKDIKGYMAISSSLSPSKNITNREDFLSGRWDKDNILSCDQPCCAKVITIKANRNSKTAIVFTLSFASTVESVLKLPFLFKNYSVKNKNSISIYTPDNNLDHLFNNWLQWQTLGGRLYARTGFYQNSGAYGFRDQLQDSCAILLLNPEITKRQIARACHAQFYEGDVLHWWHNLPGNVMRGVRTKYSDDLIWLPYTVCEYIEKTSDFSILNVKIAYCEGITLENGQQEKYGEIKNSDIKATIYEHCRKALDYSYKLGEHDLVLMGCGDWNDSFNNVGIQGKGESVWLSEFMIVVMKKFAEVAENYNDIAYKDELLLRSHHLITSIEKHCWDSEWYIRAFFDDGSELGSKNCEACQIDSLAQSFATLADLPNKERNHIALYSAYGSLVDEKQGIIKLFTPAFNKNEMPVGYATSYPRGIRENGGQYTHGSIWLAIALLEAGKYKKGNRLIKLLNPAHKYLDEKTALKYKNEPYYISADIYTNPQCYGRGGWSIYTGAASWYYRAIFEWFIGIKIKYNSLSIMPNIPDDWNDYEVNLIYRNTEFHITVTHGPKTAVYDNDIETDSIPFDKNKHEVRVVVERERKI